MLMMKQGKKKRRPLLAIAVGGMAIYGAYSLVVSAKNMCCEKAKMLTKAFKKKEKCKNSCMEDEYEDI